MKVLPIGTEVTCPLCNKVMCRLNIELTSGMRVMASYFDAVEDLPETGTIPKCPFCRVGYIGSIYGRSGMSIHTKDGWV